MKIRFGFDITITLPAPTALVMMLHTRPELADRLVEPEVLRVTPPVTLDEHIDGFGNRCTRLLGPAGPVRFQLEAVARDTGRLDPFHPAARQVPVEQLPAEVLQFLLPSRYCEVEELGMFAWQTFGAGPTGWGRVQAVCDWVHRHLRFGYEHARATRTAFDGFREGVGVCRDFTHLAITLCRCLNVPARYATGYLGDIGVPPVPDPMDFSAWFEVYLDGAWHTFDARHNQRRIGRLVMAYGRDAADVAITTTFGPHQLTNFTVVTDEIPETPA